jgi:hypothetical protein
MRNLFLFLSLTIAVAFVGCTKESYDSEPAAPPSKDLTLEGKVLKREILRVGRERVETVYTHYEEDRILEVTSVRVKDGLQISQMKFLAQDEGWHMVEIQGAPCCTGECEDLCNWQSCVDNTLNSMSSELMVVGIWCPECTVIAVSYVLFACAQPGASPNGL